MIQDLDLFEEMYDLISFGMGAIPKAEMDDFIHYLRTVLSEGTSDRALKETWRYTNADFFITGNGLRAFLARALELA